MPSHRQRGGLPGPVYNEDHTWRPQALPQASTPKHARSVPAANRPESSSCRPCKHSALPPRHGAQRESDTAQSSRTICIIDALKEPQHKSPPHVDLASVLSASFRTHIREFGFEELARLGAPLSFLSKPCRHTVVP